MSRSSSGATTTTSPSSLAQSSIDLLDVIDRVGTQNDFFRGSMAGLYAPLSTLRRHPHGRLRMTRGRCGSLHLHRGGLSPPTPCRSPGAPKNILAIVTVAGLGILAGIALAAQDRYTLKVPNGLAFSEFRGYNSWPVIAVSENNGVIAAILGPRHNQCL